MLFIWRKRKRFPRLCSDFEFHYVLIQYEFHYISSLHSQCRIKSIELNSHFNAIKSQWFKVILQSECCSPSGVERDWLLRRREGLNRVRSLKLQLFWTLVGLDPSVLISAPGERLSITDVCLLLMLCPRGLAILTRSLKLSF